MSTAKTRTPARILGRVSDEEWNVLKDAASKAGKTFTEWALTALRKEMRAQNRRMKAK